MQLELRLIILLVGLVFIGLIYFWGTRRRSRGRMADRTLGAAGRDYSAGGTSTGPKGFTADPLDELDEGPEAPAADSAVSGLPPARRQVPQATGEPVIERAADRDDSDRTASPPPPTAVETAAGTPQKQESATAAIAQIGSASANAAADDGSDLVLNPGVIDASIQGGQEALKTYRPHDLPRVGLAEDNQVNVMLLIRPNQGETFHGLKLLRALQDLGYTLNDKNTWDFHREALDAAVFSVGHLTEPGEFDIATMDTLETPGLLLFMNLPGPVSAISAVDLMLDAAVQLAEKLGGSVCSDRGEPMTLQLQQNLREEAQDFDQQRLRADG